MLGENALEVVVAAVVAARRHTYGHDRVDLRGDVLEDVEKASDLFHGHLELQDCRQHLFVENVGVDGAAARVGHQIGDGVVLLEAGAGAGQRHGDALDVVKAGSYRRPAELDHEPCLAAPQTSGDVVGLHFLGAATEDAGALMGYQYVTEGAANGARPLELVGCDRRGRAHIRLGVEAQAQKGQAPARKAHQRRVEALHAHATKARVALDACVVVHRCPAAAGIHRDRAHRTHRHAVGAADAQPRIDLHQTSPADHMIQTATKEAIPPTAVTPP